MCVCVFAHPVVSSSSRKRFQAVGKAPCPVLEQQPTLFVLVSSSLNHDPYAFIYNLCTVSRHEAERRLGKLKKLGEEGEWALLLAEKTLAEHCVEVAGSTLFTKYKTDSDTAWLHCRKIFELGMQGDHSLKIPKLAQFTLGTYWAIVHVRKKEIKHWRDLLCLWPSLTTGGIFTPATPCWALMDADHNADEYNEAYLKSVFPDEMLNHAKEETSDVVVQFMDQWLDMARVEETEDGADINPAARIAYTKAHALCNVFKLLLDDEACISMDVKTYEFVTAVIAVKGKSREAILANWIQQDAFMSAKLSLFKKHNTQEVNNAPVLRKHILALEPRPLYF